jgi:prepilin-type N-terminal cleavage/methylation domain-containing protein
MKGSKEEGFSLVELLCVVVIIGVIAALAVPALMKGVRAAENGAVFGTMRTIASTQTNFYPTHGRFGSLDEINNELSHAVGTPVGANQAEKNQFTFEMIPASPTDTELKDGYTITATRNVTGDTNIYKYSVDQTGYVTQILP